MATKPTKVVLDELQMLSGFAVDSATAFISTVRPEEWAQPNHSTFVFRVHAGVAALLQEITHPLELC